MEIDETIKNEIEHLAKIIVAGLKEKNSILINLQVEEEYSQYDVLFSYNFYDLGMHQRGITGSDLLISVIGFGCYGFSIHISDSDPSYYKEKLHIQSNFLSFLFNSVRKKLKEEIW